MRYTEKQKAEFKERFVQTRRYQIAMFVPVGGAVLVLVVGERYVAELGLQPMILGTAFLLLATAGFSWLNWRCPACRKFLGKSLTPDYCPKCGVELGSWW
jgi:phage FluMu protein Com